MRWPRKAPVCLPIVRSDRRPFSTVAPPHVLASRGLAAGTSSAGLAVNMPRKPETGPNPPEGHSARDKSPRPACKASAGAERKRN